MENSMKRVLVTGATGKVGSHFIRHVLQSEAHHDVTIRALCHNRLPEPHERLEVVRGSISDLDTVRVALEGITNVIHCATCKETPDTIMDVAVKGMFWLLEECRLSSQFRNFILIGGDAAMGHFFYPHPLPVTEQQKHTAYPGCYALSKVLEEVMLEQYYIHDLTGCCWRRGSWKRTIQYSPLFRPRCLRWPRWRDLVQRR